MTVLTRFYTYNLKGAKDAAELSIIIGNGQSAVTSLHMSGKTVASNLKDSVTDFKITDEGTSLSGKLLDISTTILDVNPDNNDISFRLKLKGGESTFFPAGDSLQVSQGGTAFFLMKIIFI